ncbi:MAG: M50 family metallopeptidase [Actinomycetota bacterium]
MFGNSWRVGRIAGVEIRVDTSWVVIAVLITYSFYVRFSDEFRDLATATAVVLAAALAILFFGSVLIHEMAHALTALRRGIPVKGITLFLFGGATNAKVDSRRPQDEFVISIVGPLTSLVLGGVFLGLGYALRSTSAPIGGGLRYLGAVNLVLAVFNMLPGFPLDGGRVLRSVVWRVTGSINRATRVASIAGQIVGYAIVAVGVLFLTQGIVGSAIWFGAIGWFLAQAARASYAELMVRGLLESVDAEDLMSPDLVRIPADLSLRDAVDRYFMRYNHGAFPVEDDGRTVGLLTLRSVRRTPQEEWGSRRARESMDTLGDQLTVPRGEPMNRVLAKLQDGESQRVLVMDGNEVVGILTAADIARWLDRRRALRT